MNNTIRNIALALVTSIMLLTGCVSPGGYGYPGGYGGNPGGYGQPAPRYPSQSSRQLQGTVDGIDSGYQRIFVVVDEPRSGRTHRTELRYDQRTRLIYQGREQPVEGLERGDVIRVTATQSGRELRARSIELVRNVRNDGHAGRHANNLRGSVAFVDTRARLIRLDGAGPGNDVQVSYDARTTVEYQGRGYRPENLQRGDIVRIQARQQDRNHWLAERIVVERSAGR